MEPTDCPPLQVVSPDINRQNVMTETYKVLTASVEEYDRIMNTYFETFASMEEMTEFHSDIRQQCLDQFDKDLNMSFELFKNKFFERQQKINSSFELKITEAKESYIKVFHK